MVNSGVFAIPTTSGGAENHVYYLVKYLSKYGDLEIDLVSDISSNINIKNLRVHEIKLRELSIFNKGFGGYMLRHAMGGIYAFKKAWNLMKNSTYDIIHVHGRVAPFLVSLFNNNTPVVFTLHDDPPVKSQENYHIYKISYKIFQETAVQRADKVIAVHNGLKNELIKRGICNSDKIHVIPNGVDMNIFKSDIKRSDSCTVLFVGSLTKRKGIKYLLMAIAEIKDARLIIVGDGPERDNLIRLAENLRIKDRVTFAGSVSHEKLPTYYSHASVFVLPSIREAFPLSILEAMACNLPVIATNTSGMPEVVKDGYNGFLVEPKNIMQLTDKIKLILSDNGMRKRMGHNARKFVEKNYSWDVVADKTIKVYMDIL